VPTGLWYVILGALFVAYALAAARLNRANVTAQMVFLAIGATAGLLALPDPITSLNPEAFETLITLTLVLLLFSDASNVGLAQLRKAANLPLRLLLIGLPLTILAGALGAWGVLSLGGLGIALLIGVILAPTDVSLGLAMFGNERVPARVRRSINVESGLNDGIAAPLVAMAIAVVVAEAEELSAPIVAAVAEIGLGVVAGVAVGAVGGVLMRASRTREWSTPHTRGFASFGLAVLAYAVSGWVGGNGFVAAFIAGLSFGVMAGDEASEPAGFPEEAGTLLSFLVWFAFGALIAPRLVSDGWAWQPILYAVLSLTLFRMLPVWASMWRTGLASSTKVFMGWFGPRGLASVVFLLDAIVELDEGGIETGLLVTTVGWTVVLSVLLHGLSAGPVAEWYVRMSSRFRQGSPEFEESPEAASRAGEMLQNATENP
jgi:sodium/hydrogen antiporter